MKINEVLCFKCYVCLRLFNVVGFVVCISRQVLLKMIYKKIDILKIVQIVCWDYHIYMEDGAMR
jgi:hypothetical protein